MAYDKVVDSVQLDSDLTSIANDIREKGETNAELAFPSGFKSAISALTVLHEYSGNLINFSTASTRNIRHMSVKIEPQQDLNGYDYSWSAGGGVNKFNPNSLPSRSQYTVNTDETITVTGSDSTAWTTIDAVSFPAGTYTVHIEGQDGYSQMRTSEDDYATNISLSSTATTFTLSQNGGIKFKFNLGGNATYPKTIKVQIEVGSTATTWTPYSNVCPISGWDEVKIYRMGKNLLNDISPDAKQAYITGANKIGASASDRLVIVPIKPNTDYTWTWNRSAIEGSANDDTNVLLFAEYPVIGNTVGTATGVNMSSSPAIRTFNSGNNIYAAIKIAHVNKTNYQETLSASQLETGSASTVHEPYTGTVYTVDLDGTRYGGTLDVVTGVLTVDRVHTTLDGTHSIQLVNWRPTTTSVGWAYSYATFPDRATLAGSGTIGNILSDKLKTASYDNAYWGDYDAMISGTNLSTYSFFIRYPDTSLTTATAINTFLSTNPINIVYAVEKPFTIQLSPETVSTLVGLNNVWADTGDVSLEYVT